ncbi:MAG: TonB-dependent receptor [Cytophagaceae bacterium]|nr:TonB-dependent receptor [Gemmatimonadaceae bacterium]
MIRLVSLFVAAMFVGGALAAQDARDSTSLPRIVITADRVPVPIAQVTSTVTVIDAAVLRAAGVTHVIDVLRRVPGLSIARSGSFGGQASVFTRGGESDYTKVLIDGVAMNDPGGSVDLAALTLDDVERIEVVRGPASVVHGSDAVSGVVQVFTRRARGPAVHLSAGGGSYGSSVFDGGASLIAGRLGASASVARHATDGILAFNNRYENTLAGARLTLAGGTPASLAFRHVDNSFAYPTDGAGNVVDRNAAREDRRSSLVLDAERPLGSRIVARLSGGWLDAAGRTDDGADGPADTLGLHTYRSQGSMRRRQLAATVQWAPTATHAVVAGAEWAGENQRLSDSSNYAFERSHFAADRNTRAAFAQVMGHGNRGSYTVGGRIDRNDVYGTFRTARATAALTLPAGLRLRGGLGTSFKAPTFFEQFSTGFSVGNARLDPERATSWEAAIDRRGDRLDVSATWFSQRFRDLIQYTYLSPTDPSYFNVAEARAQGLELEGEVRATSSTTVRAGATFLETQVDNAGFDSGPGATFVNGSRLLRRPSSTISIGGTTRVGSRTNLDVQAQRTGRRDDRDFSGYPAAAVVLAAYTRFDVGAQVRLTPAAATTAVRLVVRADNVFGVRYVEVANFQAPRRNLFAGLRAEWGR